MLNIIPIGGFGEVGRNCVAIEYKSKKADPEIVIFDLGLNMDAYVEFAEDRDSAHFTYEQLRRVHAVPDLNRINRKHVKAICISHGHLDHVGGVPYLAPLFDCAVHGTPFTIGVLQAMMHDNKRKLKNLLETHEPGEIFKVSENLAVEFIHVTHSIPGTAILVVHSS